MPEQRKNILVVDDDTVQTKLLEGLLKDKYNLVIAADAADGLQRAMRDNPDVIILDVMMPIINGYNFCKLLKDSAGHEQTAVILVTSRDEKEDVEIGLEMGADAYLTKPVHTEELLKTINLVLSKYKVKP